MNELNIVTTLVTSKLITNLTVSGLAVSTVNITMYANPKNITIAISITTNDIWFTIIFFIIIVLINIINTVIVDHVSFYISYKSQVLLPIIILVADAK